MPCYTEIIITVKDKDIAEKTLKAMGIKGQVIKKANTNSYEIILDDRSLMTNKFRDDFFQEYGVQVATLKAESEGYFVTRDYNEDTGEVELTLRQY